MTALYATAVDAYLRSIVDDLNALQCWLNTHPEDADRIWTQIQASKLFHRLNTLESSAVALIPRSER